MTKPNDGGPASKKSLRAYLAAKAISVIRPVYEVTSEPHKSEDGQLPPFSKIRAAVIAREACEVADAVLAELEKGAAGTEEEIAPPGPKFKKGDPVRVVAGNRDTPGVGQTGVVQNVNKYEGAIYAYLARLDKEISRCHVFGYHEHELEAVHEEGE